MSLRFALAVGALLAIAPAGADRFELRDGRRVDGRLVVEVDGVLSIETDAGTVVVKRADVARVRSDDELSRELATRVAQALELPERPRAHAYVAAAAWAEEYPGLRDRAAELYRDAVQLDADLANLVDHRLLALAIRRKRWDEGQRIARAALERNPNHERVAQLARELAGEAVTEGADRLAPLIDAYRRRRYDRVIQLAATLLGSKDEAELAQISTELERRAGTSLADILVDCRFNGTCKASRCEGGMIRCARCEATGTENVYHRPVVGSAGGVVNQERTVRWCSQCDGLGHEVCRACRAPGSTSGARCRSKCRGWSRRWSARPSRPARRSTR